MTLVLAIPGNREVVVAADTYIYSDYGEGCYGSNGRKIWRAGNWLIAVAGSELGRAILDKLELERVNYTMKFDSVCNELAERISAAFGTLDETTKEKHAFSVLACGVEDGTSRIKEWKSSSKFPQDCSRRPTAIGVKNHGGIYLAYRHYNLALSTAQRMLLAYYCVYAVTLQDLRVGPPIHVAVVKEREAASIYEGDQLADFQSRSAEISELMRQQFLRDAPPVLPPSEHEPDVS